MLPALIPTYNARSPSIWLSEGMTADQARFTNTDQHLPTDFRHSAWAASAHAVAHTTLFIVIHADLGHDVPGLRGKQSLLTTRRSTPDLFS